MKRVLSCLFILLFIGFALWSLDQLKIINLKATVLQTVSMIPGFSNIYDNYNLGRNSSAQLRDWEKELLLREKKSKDDSAKLEADRQSLVEERQKWQNNLPSPTPNAAAVKTVSPDIIFPGTAKLSPEAKLATYLDSIGKMKPKQAAVVIQKLPVETVFMIFDRSSSYHVARIMENLPESYLAQLTQERLNLYRNQEAMKE